MAGMDDHETDDPSGSQVNNEFNGVNLGNAVQAGFIDGGVHSTIRNSTIAGGNVDHSRRIKIGLGGLAAVLLLGTTGTIAYKIGTSEATPANTPANISMMATLPSATTSAVAGGVPGAGVRLEGPMNPSFAMMSLFAAVAYDDPLKVCPAIFTEAGLQQLVRDFGGDSCSDSIDRMSAATPDRIAFAGTVVPRDAVIYSNHNHMAAVDTCYVTHPSDANAQANNGLRWGKFTLVNAAFLGGNSSETSGWVITGHEPATGPCTNS